MPDWPYTWNMKIETTVFLSEELVAALGSRAPDAEHRSELVEAALREYLPLLHDRPSKDLEIINAHAAELNQEAEDVLSYQVIP
jgi:metal-responsive CopG/Arc/MetJ family transcriptional regulator